ncbi:hypothetical protein [Methylobacterium sp. SyP6R]|uniref:hypothetical protein n=1 Tax=Methylobacterium sp. SyP6R TaxID=2718876 RepID=UPI001F260CBF|nr:hypothetical protein [Methylobacterium sp. SyP6R]MCF4127551.1 hypothetical protein [Methylobacterium sp. SyP6R]
MITARERARDTRNLESLLKPIGREIREVHMHAARIPQIGPIYTDPETNQLPD